MKKYTFVCHSHDFRDFLDRLQSVGVVDITQTVCSIEGGEKKIINWIKLCGEAIDRLEVLKTSERKPLHSIRDPRKATYILKEFQKDQDRFNRISAEISEKEKNYAEHLPWGNYDPQRIEALRQKGVCLNFFVCENSNFDPQWAEDYALEIVNKTKTQTYFTLIALDDEKIVINANEFRLLNKSLNTQLEEIQALKVDLSFLDKQFVEMLPYLPTLKDEKIRLIDALAYDRVSTCTEMGLENKIRIIYGFVPESQEKSLQEMIKREDVIALAEEPSEEDDTPILLKNNRFSKVFEPITRIFSLPIYHEMDLTPFFAPFFMLFVGFCTGDAGYGLLLILAGMVAKRKLPEDMRAFASLAQWFGLAAIVFGALSGTFFGISLVEIPALQNFRQLFFDQDKMMTLSLIMGGVQILFGMILNIVNIILRKGLRFAVGKIGWFCLLIFGGLLIGLPYVGYAVPAAYFPLFYALMGLSAVAIFFFNSPGSSPFLQMGLGVWDAYNVATGLLGDLLSYVRLFALGLTGGILGMVFNSLAFDMSPDLPFFGGLVTLLILLVGHSLNFCLTMLGAVVHPLRLTFVEFYKNAGFEGGGREYRPFKKVKNLTKI